MDVVVHGRLKYNLSLFENVVACLFSLQHLPWVVDPGNAHSKLARWVTGNNAKITEGELKQTGSSSSRYTKDPFLDTMRDVLGLLLNE